MVDLDQYLAPIGAGDQSALMRWIAGADPVLRGKLRPLAARVDAEAVLQEAYVRIWYTATRCVPDDRPNALLRYAARIVHNLAIDELRRARLVPTEQAALEAELAHGPAEPEAPDPMLRELIAWCRHKLPPKPAAALQARLDSGGGEPDSTLAERVGMRLNTFLQNIKRARELLAECLRRRGAAEALR
jgi:RNA polymerase sigma-70 factor (ECF subfamily)